MDAFSTVEGSYPCMLRINYLVRKAKSKSKFNRFNYTNNGRPEGAVKVKYPK